MEVENLKNLIENLNTLRSKWSTILEECKLVAANSGISNEFPEKSYKASCWWISRRIERDCRKMLQGRCFPCFNGQYKAVHKINEMFSFLWNYLKLAEDEIQNMVKKWLELYQKDVSEDKIALEIDHLKTTQPAHFKSNLKPLELLNILTQKKISNPFPNICIALWIFCTLAVTVAEAERSFSLLDNVTETVKPRDFNFGEQCCLTVGL